MDERFLWGRVSRSEGVQVGAGPAQVVKLHPTEGCVLWRGLGVSQERGGYL